MLSLINHWHLLFLGIPSKNSCAKRAVRYEFLMSQIQLKNGGISRCVTNVNIMVTSFVFTETILYSLAYHTHQASPIVFFTSDHMDGQRAGHEMGEKTPDSIVCCISSRRYSQCIWKWWRCTHWLHECSKDYFHSPSLCLFKNSL